MDWRMDDWSLSSRVSPFRYLRINGYLLLPVAFRSLSRLSSALSAKASTLRSFLLDLFRCIALHLLSQLLIWNWLLIRTYKNFRFYFGLFFSDVLIFLKEFSIISLYEVFKEQESQSDSTYQLCKELNGDGEIRTHDPLLARQVLSQLSYAPIKSGNHLLSHVVSNIVSSAA